MGFFKQYDMRGTFGVDFGLETVRKVGAALPRVISGKRWLIGRDCRVTSDDVRDALLVGLCSAGVEVTDLGRCTTPMVYFFTAVDGYDGSVMITASHNPPSDNGLKVSKRTALPVGYADGLSEVERLVAADATVADAPVADGAAADEAGFRARYLDFLRGKLAERPLGGLRIGIDCSNGMASLFVRELFPDAVVINGTPDGDFPCHSPNPLKAEAREQLARLVRERGLDCGIIFDGDADRAMFVDARGEFDPPDYHIPIPPAATRGDGPGGRVLHDVRTSRGVVEALREMGCEPVMVPVGHAFAKPRMRETGAVCGGELAGHYYFREFFGCDSGILAAIRILQEFARFRQAAPTAGFGEMVRPIASRYANSGELNFRVEDKDAAIGRVLTAAKSLGEELSRSELDGLRVEFADGWFNVRKSNTEPFLRLIVEARTPSLMREWVARFRSVIDCHCQA